MRLTKEEALAQADAWNAKMKPGMRVLVTTFRPDEEWFATLETAARVDDYHKEFHEKNGWLPMLRLAGHDSQYTLDCLTPVEHIVAAAVRTKSFFNDHVLVFQVSPPGRHCDLMGVGDRKAEERMEQGFVTSAGRFVGRHEAKKIAVAAGQLLERAGDTASLFSEDVW